MLMRHFKNVYLFLLKKYPKATLVAVVAMALAYAFCLPSPLFDRPTCMVLEDRDGQLLGAKIAADGQWRFPPIQHIPQKFETALLEFEDRRFHRHPGFDIRSLGRALVQNIRNGRIVSGGSTLTMQVIRLSRPGKPRSVWQKGIEIILATRLELGYSKADILKFYATHAPFGGNVVGLETASWRYFGKGPHLLSWAEAAMLAVLPNSPGLIHPGRNREALFQKRNRLLTRLQEAGHIDTFTLELAMAEPLPEEPLPLPQLAPHLLERAHAEHILPHPGRQTRIQSSVDMVLQQKLNTILSQYQKQLSYNEIYNLAALILDVETGQVLAYGGNAPNAGDAHSGAVDIIPARRSTGSIVKPLLYALALQEGTILPNSLLPDVPTQMSGYRPENFHEEYDGVVTARRALIRSLNVPIIHLLQQYGLEKFHYQLQKLGFSTIDQPPGHYGLPLVLGGAEATLWDLTSTYASMARTLNHHYDLDGQYLSSDFRKATYLLDSLPEAPPQKTPPILSHDAIWLTFEAMQEVERPSSEGAWQVFRSSRKVAWKTGTSFGFRDAWAIGVSPRYAVGVWAGNADGEGRPGLVGIQAAAPVLFDIFELLPAQTEWFSPPYDAMQETTVCAVSGYRPLAYCPVDTVWATAQGYKTAACTFHQRIHLDPTEQWRVTTQCSDPGTMKHKDWFILPPVQAYYHRQKNPAYQPLPPLHPDCRAQADESIAPMQIVYPKQSTAIYVPVDLDGQLSKTVFSVAHRQPETAIYWHIDEQYMGTTQFFHDMELRPAIGKHKLTLVDEVGNRLERWFEIIAKNE
jgi:penicillin-binding protein 1C